MSKICPVTHATVTTRYCPQCGDKIAQPLDDLKAHIRSQEAKAQNAGNEKAEAKWASWRSALNLATSPAVVTSSASA